MNVSTIAKGHAHVDAIYPIVNHVHSFKSLSLSKRVVTITKRFIFDAIAVMMAGSQAKGCAEIAAYAVSWKGEPSAGLVTGARAPAPYAAMANSMMAHAVEFDDTYEPGDVHGYAVVLPAVLAAAEFEAGRKVRGIDLIAAVAIGIDVAYRLGEAIKTYRGWQPTSTCGNLGGALAAARIAACTKEQVHHSVGIAYALVAGNFQALVDAGLTKRLQPGFAARAAVESVLLAKAGITGAKNVLEGTFGFYKLYEANEYDSAILTNGIGEIFLGERASMKPYPCCRSCHAAIDAALMMLQDSKFPSGDRVDQIARLEVEIPSEVYDLVGRPFAVSDSPEVSAQFSVAYALACAFIRRTVGLSEFSADVIRAPALGDLARRIVVKTIDSDRYGAVTVRADLKSGEHFEQRVKVMKGEPGNPLNENELANKARSCVAYGGFPPQAADELWSWAEFLDRDPDPISRLNAIFQMKRGS